MKCVEIAYIIVEENALEKVVCYMMIWLSRITTFTLQQAMAMISPVPLC